MPDQATLPGARPGNHGRSRLSHLARVVAALLAATAGLTGAASLGTVYAVLRPRRVVVHGRSMAPTLLPGDRVLVVRMPWRRRHGPGQLVAARDPREPARLLLKRVSSVDAGGEVSLAGDNPAESTDSRTFGPVPRRSVLGRAVYRYAPFDRAGRIR